MTEKKKKVINGITPGTVANWSRSGYIYGYGSPGRTTAGSGLSGIGSTSAGGLSGLGATQGQSANKYRSAYEAAYNAIANREKFNYKQQDDPLYQQYADMYTKQAKLGMENTVGQISALTGGYGNSYAETAGQAMYANIMDQMNDKALDLYNAALDRYNMEGNQLAQQFDMAAQMYGNEEDAIRYAEQMAYQRERDAIADARYDREWNYNVGRDAIADQRYDREWNYNVGRDEVADRRYDQEWKYSKERDKIADERYDAEWKYSQDRDEANDNFRNAQLEEEKRQFDKKYDYDDLAARYNTFAGNTANVQHFIANGGNVKGNSNNNKIHSKDEYSDMIGKGNKSLVVTTTDKNGKRSNEYFNAQKYGSEEAAYGAYVNAWLNQTNLSEKEKDYLYWYYTQ